MFLISPKLSLFVIVFIPICGFVISVVGKSLRRKSLRVQKEQGQFISLVDETLSGMKILKIFNAENKFLDDVAEKLGLNQSKYLEIKKIETASLKYVDFGDKADESIFGLSKDMDDKTKCRILRQEYSRWNSQTNNSNKDKRVRAKEMVNLIANLRKQYNC